MEWMCLSVAHAVPSARTPQRSRAGSGRQHTFSLRADADRRGARGDLVAHRTARRQPGAAHQRPPARRRLGPQLHTHFHFSDGELRHFRMRGARAPPRVPLLADCMQPESVRRSHDVSRCRRCARAGVPHWRSGARPGALERRGGRRRRRRRAAAASGARANAAHERRRQEARRQAADARCPTGTR